MIPETLRSYALTLDYLRRLVADVPDVLMACQASGATNHPAWVIGHLTYSCQALGGELGLDPWLPADWEAKFGTGSVPQADGYLPKESLLAALADGQQRIASRLTSLGEAALAEPLPDVRYRETFPTLGHAVLHILTSHAAVHVGQVTVWRRVVNLGPLPDAFI